MTGVEMYGKTAIMPGGNTYFQLVSNTYYDVAGQTDVNSNSSSLYVVVVTTGQETEMQFR